MKKEYRIKKNEEIESVLNERNSIASKYFVIYKKENHETNHYRYAISVPKKFGNAVNRNLMKRRIRSVVRDVNLLNNYDFFIVVKIQASSLSFLEIKKELLSLFTNLKLEVAHE